MGGLYVVYVSLVKKLLNYFLEGMYHFESPSIVYERHSLFVFFPAFSRVSPFLFYMFDILCSFSLQLLNE
jgi:hypothetical protein